MVTTVKISDSLKRKLEELQAKLLLNQNQKVNQQVLLERLLEYALKNAGDLLEIMTSDGEQESEDYAIQVLDKPKDWGITDSSENIDEHLYGAGEQ
jgi:hypothetical protein